MERYVCIHGHFYQPPRDNPWLEEVELQDSAYPYHDWNERITAECYAPNAAARLLDDEGRIVRIVNNYAQISFNVGPTLLAWLEAKAGHVYQALLEADRRSRETYSGHGNALAQAYNHVLLPLASERDRQTQILWGLRDFAHRFGRPAEGMWLPETAVDLATLELLAEQGVRFTVLAPHQAARVRPVGTEAWQDVGGGRIDPTTAYVQRLPSGRSISLFFYDGPIARAVAFEGLLRKGEYLADRLCGAFTAERPWPQLVHIATDGETYGHHHRHGEMALAYALHHIRTTGRASLTNYGEYLEKHPPTHEVEIVEHTSWSCVHGVERWRADCGCNTGRDGWNQAWRAPLREALDWLRDAVAPRFEKAAAPLLRQPWAARDDYSAVLLDRSPANVARFLAEHAARDLTPAESATALKLLELQRQALLMYTSCGWFFDELSGPETVQALLYAGRALQLAEDLFGDPLEPGFLGLLERARSNLPEQGDGRRIYETFVRPAVVDWEDVGAHYAVSALFETFPDRARVFCYTAEREDFRSHTAGKARLVVGRARLTSEVTGESETVAFGALHFGDHNVSGGVRRFQGDAAYARLSDDLAAAFQRADFPEVLRLFDRGFGEATYSLRSLFRDQQRKIIKQVLRPHVGEAEQTYRRLYREHQPMLRFLAELGNPLPPALERATEYVINTDLRWALKDDEPDLRQVRDLLAEAARWRVPLDTAGLAYRLKKTTGRLAERFAARPDNLELLTSLDAIVALAQELPFEVDLWQPQNAFYEVMQAALPRLRARGLLADERARTWADHFLALGERLGIQVRELRAMVDELKQGPTVAALVDEAFAGPRIPAATYRLQLNRGFTFRDARELAPYLHVLGVSDCYTSPLLQARPGSTHGYDICDPGRLSTDLGGDEEFTGLADALRHHDLGLVLDTVPNHMGIGDSANAWWTDVLENGPSSIYAAYFDIDWHPVNPSLKNKVLLPLLEDQYGSVLESGKIRLAYEEGAFALYYYEHRLPVAPRTYRAILEHQLGALEAALGEEHEHVQELHSILTALRYLPPRRELPREKRVERNREKEVIKRRIAALVNASPEVRAAIDTAVRAFNGRVGDSRSFDLLDRLLEEQAYRPAYWRVAAEDINYRRFFDINELAAIRVELPEVFQATHQVIFRLLAAGVATGLRIDHPDGLLDPAAYFRRLQEGYLVQRVRAQLGPDAAPPGLEQEVAARLAAHRPAAGAGPGWPLYVVAEKILGDNEPLPADWAVYGTTGYDFLNAVNGLFVDPAAAAAFEALYSGFIGRRIDFAQLVIACQKTILLVSMASELNALSHQLDRISERNRRYRDFTLNSLTLAIREIIASLFIYRTYITGPDTVSARDRRFLEQAVEDAKDQNPGTAAAIFDFVRDTLLLRNIHDFPEEDRPRLIGWVMKFQQLSAPVLAKGLEDTAFYVYNRLVSLNEVGGHPERFGIAVADFHRHNAERLRQWPHSMLATSSHDTKRSEDVRARINVLSEMPDDWAAALDRWRRLNAPHKTLVEGQPAPDANDEYLLYQTLLGTWPASPPTPTEFADFRARVRAYLQKATKEAKVHTSWVNPNADYDQAVADFVDRLLSDRPDNPFLADLLPLQHRLAFFGYVNALAQVLLKLTSPGVPDIYQGTELWSFSLVDPDNRRPVDYTLRRRLLAGLQERITTAGHDLRPLAGDLLAHLPDGRIKLYVLYRALGFRRDHRLLFADGSYQALDAEGTRAAHVCAFARRRGDETALTVVPRLVLRLTGGVEQPPTGAAVWQDTQLRLPDDLAGHRFRNLYTGELLTAHGAALPLEALLGHFPVALLAHLPSDRSSPPA